MSVLTQALNFVVPSPFQRPFRAFHRDYVFHSAFHRFVKTPEAALDPELGLLSQLIYGWGNEGWSAREEFLVAALRHALCTKGNILECGTGLSTLLLGIIAQQNGRCLWSLEHSRPWGRKVRDELRTYRIDSVNMFVKPMKDYGEYTWYDAPLDKLPGNISLVVCDGPPGSTPGGRYGLVPVMKRRLAPGAVILLKDGIREGEQAIASRWVEETGADGELIGEVDPYIELRLPRRS